MQAGRSLTLRLCIAAGRVRNNRGSFFRTFRLCCLAVCFFGTFQRFQGPARASANRKGHSWPACKSAAPCKSACNSGQGRECERPAKEKEKEELRPTWIANYPWKQAAVDAGGRSRWHRKLLRSSIAGSWSTWPAIAIQNAPRIEANFRFEKVFSSYSKADLFVVDSLAFTHRVSCNEFLLMPTAQYDSENSWTYCCAKNIWYLKLKYGKCCYYYWHVGSTMRNITRSIFYWVGWFSKRVSKSLNVEVIRNERREQNLCWSCYRLV